MLAKEELCAFARTIGLSATGVCRAERDTELYEQLKKRRSLASFSEFEAEDLALRTDPGLQMEGAKSFFVCLFPYHRSDLPKGNLSDYAKIPDYHQVAKLYLEKIGAFIKEREPRAQFKILCDSHPLTDRRLAYLSGLGFYGRNNLLIHPVFGSYFFIGSLLLNIPLEPDSPMEASCSGCGACMAACPGKALGDDFSYDYTKCISYITQAKEITKDQETLLAGQDSVYGCDICQSVCPHNKGVPDTPIPEFNEQSLSSLSAEELMALSGRAFKKKYENFAFAWCKKQSILKNFTEKR